VDFATPSSEDILKIRENACSGMFSDLTDGNPRVRIWSDFKSTGTENILGIVRTIEIESKMTNDENLSLGLPFLTSLNAGDVLVVKSANHFAYFGELMANLAQRIGVVGSIIFGASRDTRAIGKINFPLFARSFTPVDIKGRGRVKIVDAPLIVDGYEITPGSWVFADSDGAVFFPSDISSEIFTAVLALIEKEKAILHEIAQNATGEELANRYKGF
jgi:regulator of RNase E activity RraA